MTKLCAILLASLLFHATTLRAVEDEPIALPFGLSWVASHAQIEQLIKNANLHVSQKQNIEGRETWTVEGFDQPALSAVVFYFLGDDLDELELQYRDPKWSLNKFGEFMAQVKQELDLKYGRAEVLAHSRGPEKDVSQTVVGYRWQHPAQCLDLIFYSAERDPLAFRLLSMHYKVQHQPVTVADSGRTNR